MSDPLMQEPRAPATRRILDAARDLLIRGGAAEISMGDVASVAGVSKALIHYHFRDKNSLLSTLADEAGRATLDRERAAMLRAPGGHALDSYWEWLHDELGRGDIQVLVALGQYDSEDVRVVTRRVAEARRALTAEHVGSVFEQLGLTPRLPTALIADTVVAFRDGLALAYALNPERDPRPAFDVLWLALLTLAE